MSLAAQVRGPASAAGRLLTGRAGRGGGVVLGYHDVVAGPDVELDLNVTAEALRMQLELVRRVGYRIVPLSEITALAVAGESVDGLAAVTFDDALAGVLHHGLPVLRELDVPATVFVVATGWGERPAWWPGSGPTMTRAELVESSRAGLVLAPHSRTHASLPRLGPADLRAEVAGSLATLQDLGEGVLPVFAYPFGHHDAAVRAAVAEAGCTAAYSFLNGRVTGAEDRWRLPRLTMGRHHDRRRFAYHLARPPASWPDHQADEVTGAPVVRRPGAE